MVSEEKQSEIPEQAPAEAGAAGEGEVAAEDLTALLEEARAKADDHWNQLLRTQAEMENLRKRTERDLANARKFALEKFVAELLPVKDSLEMGLSAAATEAGVDADKLREGGELTLKMFAAAVEKFGVREIDPQGEKFNPELHEAMTLQERADVEPNTVVAVLQKGYVLNDRLIRPAMVMVSRAAGDAPRGGSVDERA